MMMMTRICFFFQHFGFGFACGVAASITLSERSWIGQRINNATATTTTGSAAAMAGVRINIMRFQGVSTSSLPCRGRPFGLYGFISWNVIPTWYRVVVVIVAVVAVDVTA
jgi:hypothetical protein